MYSCIPSPSFKISIHLTYNLILSKWSKTGCQLEVMITRYSCPSLFNHKTSTKAITTFHTNTGNKKIVRILIYIAKAPGIIVISMCVYIVAVHMVKGQCNGQKKKKKKKKGEVNMTINRWDAGRMWATHASEHLHYFFAIIHYCVNQFSMD